MSELLAWFLFLPPVIFIFLYLVINHMVKGERSICVVVLGDFGRSPRMQYHCLSLASEGYNVDVACYGGSKPHRDIQENEKIEQHIMREPPAVLKYMPRLMNYVLKVIWQSLSVMLTLLLLPKFSHVILQNPPAIPSLAVVWFVCLVRGSTLVTDWHNYGFTILSLALGDMHPLVQFSKWYEGWFGCRSKFNICVTEAMKEDLKTVWKIEADVLYDRPPDMFKETDLETKHKLFKRLSGEYEIFKPSKPSEEEMTAFTVRRRSGIVENVEKRSALVISSTSWTEDEDFSILLAALDEYDVAAQKPGSDLPPLKCVITGKGPQKAFYQGLLSQKKFGVVKVCLPWLESGDYPLMLGSADLGVCLHKSSSGLDLPMKVVDMFGCALPVCALHFECLRELVHHGENGMVFHNSTELAMQMQTLLKGFPHKNAQLEAFRENLKVFRRNRWHPNWKRVVLPILKGNNINPDKKDS
ncbi:chitobiosyldiphosphodolichol beta-mannosyltransferase-like [Liolophura sinensis]|uniref:chitobiosyldiphosphodolichol beta-mannosyltransferase-like n=1 Tax=Liolophura sinensis TaxID=3198878 RepID=UPI003158FF52